MVRRVAQIGELYLPVILKRTHQVRRLEESRGQPLTLPVILKRTHQVR